MSRGPDVWARRLAILLGGVVLTNVVVEAGLATVVGDPLQTPFSTPEARFQLVGSVVPRLVQIVGGLGLLTAGYWNSPRQASQQRVGWSFLILAGLVLLPLVMLMAAFGSFESNLPPAGLLRLRIQFVRIILFYATVSLTLWSLGRLLLARSRSALAVSPAA